MAESVTRYLLDSVILIDHFNGIAAATHFLQEHKQDLSISVNTRAAAIPVILATITRVNGCGHDHFFSTRSERIDASFDPDYDAREETVGSTSWPTSLFAISMNP